MNGKGNVILNYNFKGGVGKTTITSIESFILEREGSKILLIDFDIQQNLTEVMKQTYNRGKNFETNISLYNAMNNGNFNNAIAHVTDNLDLIPNDSKTDLWFKRCKLGDSERYKVLDNLIKTVKDDYDYIFIDVPPSINDPVINAMYAADGISIVLQTQQLAYTSALKTVQYLAKFREEYDAKFTLLGIIIYLVNTTKVSKEIVSKARKNFSGGLYANSIHFQERINGFMMNGITTNDYWDKRAIGMYRKVTDELVKRMKEMNDNA